MSNVYSYVVDSNIGNSLDIEVIDRNREVFDRIERDKLDGYYNNVETDECYNAYTDPDRDYDDSKELDR